MSDDMNALNQRYYELLFREHGSSKRLPCWMGYRLKKYPTDLLTYHRILWDTSPDLLIECGTWRGGSALFFASIFDLAGRGQVLSIDVDNAARRKELPQHDRITYLSGSSTDAAIIEAATAAAHSAPKTMVVLDSKHTAEHVASELFAYDALVTPECYLVVEDTVLSGHPVPSKTNPGPYEAVEAFLAKRGGAYRKTELGRKGVFSQQLDGWLLKL